MDDIVQFDQRRNVLLAHLELHREHRHAGLRHGIDVIDAGDLRQHLLGRRGHRVRHILRRRAGIGDQHVGHGDVDLRLFLARGHQHGECAEQQRHQRQQRRHLRMQEGSGNTSGYSHCLLHQKKRPATCGAFNA